MASIGYKNRCLIPKTPEAREYLKSLGYEEWNSHVEGDWYATNHSMDDYGEYIYSYFVPVLDMHTDIYRKALLDYKILDNFEVSKNLLCETCEYLSDREKRVKSARELCTTICNLKCTGYGTCDNECTGDCDLFKTHIK